MPTAVATSAAKDHDHCKSQPPLRQEMREDLSVFRTPVRTSRNIRNEQSSWSFGFIEYVMRRDVRAELEVSSRRDDRPDGTGVDLAEAG